MFFERSWGKISLELGRFEKFVANEEGVSSIYSGFREQVPLWIDLREDSSRLKLTQILLIDNISIYLLW